MSNKIQSEKFFEVSPDLHIHAWSENTRYGFRHLARLRETGAQAKACYYNRTWEAWEFQSVVRALADKVNDLDAGKIRAFANDEPYDNSAMKTVGMVAALGSIFCDTPKEQNDWKLRMIKAGLEPSGLSIPDDWDTLTEEEKTRRLDAVTQELLK